MLRLRGKQARSSLVERVTAEAFGLDTGEAGVAPGPQLHSFLVKF